MHRATQSLQMHYAMRWLLHHGAARHRMPHEGLSFTGLLQLFRREQPLSGAPSVAQEEPTASSMPEVLAQVILKMRDEIHGANNVKQDALRYAQVRLETFLPRQAAVS